MVYSGDVYVELSEKKAFLDAANRLQLHGFEKCSREPINSMDCIQSTSQQNDISLVHSRTHSSNQRTSDLSTVYNIDDDDEITSDIKKKPRMKNVSDGHDNESNRLSCSYNAETEVYEILSD